MKQLLINLDPSKILFFDIETVRQNKELNTDSREFKLYQYKIRGRETDILPDVATTVENYARKAALNPVYGKIISITIGSINGDKIRLKSFYGDEKDIIEKFYELVASLNGYLLCGWNQEFDIPYTRKRAAALGVTNFLPDKCGNDAGERPWSVKGLLDLMGLVKGIGFYNDSLDEIAYLLGIDSPKEGDITGAGVSEAYYAGLLDDIVAYNRRDVITLANIYRKLTYQSIITNIEDAEVKTEKVPLLEKIFNTKKVTAKEKALLEVLVDELTDEEKKDAKIILETTIPKVK